MLRHEPYGAAGEARRRFQHTAIAGQRPDRDSQPFLIASQAWPSIRIGQRHVNLLRLRWLKGPQEVANKIFSHVLHVLHQKYSHRS